MIAAAKRFSFPDDSSKIRRLEKQVAKLRKQVQLQSKLLDLLHQVVVHDNIRIDDLEGRPSPQGKPIARRSRRRKQASSKGARG